MAELTTYAFPLVEVVAALDPDQPAREPGHHVTDLIEASMALAKGKDPFTLVGAERQVEFDDTPGILDAGKMWEAASRPLMVKRVEALGPEYRIEFTTGKTVEEVMGSFDGIIYHHTSIDTAVIVVDSKLRFTKPGEDPRDRMKWMMQFKAYCKMTGTGTVWIPVCYWGARPPSVQSMLYVVTYNQVEIDENWQTLMSTKRWMDENKPKKDNEDKTNNGTTTDSS